MKTKCKCGRKCFCPYLYFRYYIRRTVWYKSALHLSACPISPEHRRDYHHVTEYTYLPLLESTAIAPITSPCPHGNVCICWHIIARGFYHLIQQSLHTNHSLLCPKHRFNLKDFPMAGARRTYWKGGEWRTTRYIAPCDGGETCSYVDGEPHYDHREAKCDNPPHKDCYNCDGKTHMERFACEQGRACKGMSGDGHYHMRLSLCECGSACNCAVECDPQFRLNADNRKHEQHSISCPKHSRHVLLIHGLEATLPGAKQHTGGGRLGGN